MLKSEGRENIPEREAFILASNHASFIDVPCITSACPRRIHWVARKSLYEVGWLRLILNITKCIPVNGATQRARSALKNGMALGIFPEGTRTYDGNLQEGKSGAAVLALKTGTKIVPVAISGTFKVFPRTSRLPKLFMPVRVKFGAPFSVGIAKQETIDAQTLEGATKKIMSEIQSLRGGA